MGTSIGIANAIGFGRPRGGVILPQWFKDSLVCWYNPKKQGLTNDKIEKGKPFLLKDFSGNHLDMTMHNFDGEGMSGMGGYAISWNKLQFNGKGTVIGERLSDTKIHFSEFRNTIAAFYFSTKSAPNIESYKIKVSGLEKGQSLRLIYLKEDGTNAWYHLTDNNGIVDVPKSFATTSEKYIYYGFAGGFVGKCDITIEQLPLYEGSLCFDGVDDYGISENQPILTDYTVIARRKWIDATEKGCLASKAYSHQSISGAFQFERYKTNETVSFNVLNTIKQEKENISWQSTILYNNQNIYKGPRNDSKTLILGRRSVDESANYSSFALYEFLLFNRTLTQDEIDFVKYVVMKEPLPEPIAVYSAKGRTNEDADRDILPNLAPNGNHDYDIKLHNFAFEGMSGYGGYGTDFENWNLRNNDNSFGHRINNKNVTIIKGERDKGIWSCLPKIGTSIKLIVKIKGITNKNKLYFYGLDNPHINLSNGENIIEGTVRKYIGFATEFDGDCNITIELLPKYPDGLVFDGVDDYGINENMPIFTPEKGYTVIAERKILFNHFTGFVCGKDNGVSTSFNFEGLLNKTTYNTFSFNVKTQPIILPPNISWQTSCLYNNQKINKGDIIDNSNLLILGRGFLNSTSTDMVLYEFHLFDHDLTPKEIEMYIQKKINKKYKLPIVEQSKE